MINIFLAKLCDPFSPNLQDIINCKPLELVAGWSVINGGLPGLLGYTAWKEEDEICSADISAWRKKAASGS